MAGDAPGRQNEEGKTSFALRTGVWAAAVVVVPVIVSVLVSSVQARVDNREHDIKMVELALGILREDPSETELNAVRGWAVDLLSRYSGQKIDEVTRDQLIDNQLPPWTFTNVDDPWLEPGATFPNRGAPLIVFEGDYTPGEGYTLQRRNAPPATTEPLIPAQPAQ